MLPEICSLGPLTLHSYGLAIALGVFLAVFFMTRAAGRFGFPPVEKVFDLVFVVVFFGFLGARILYILQEWRWYQGHPLEIFQIWKGGLVYYGGMMASFLALFICLRRNRLPFLATTDFAISYVPLVHAFGRIGCFLNGCCFGKASTLPWAVLFPGFVTRLHPVQLYEAVFNLALFGFLARHYARRNFPGEVISLYLIFYSAGRFFLEFFRGDQTKIFLSLSLPQVMSFIFAGAGILLYGICRSRR